MADARVKIEALAAEVQEVRASFFERTTFWVSILFAPLAVVGGLFGGVQMEKKFAEERYSLFHGDYAGWLFFGLVCGVCSLAIGMLWYFMRRANLKKRPWE